MGVKVNYSRRWDSVKKRINRIPKIAFPIMRAFVKTDALSMIKEFHDGIKKKAFGLEKLASGTVKRKRSLGMERPSTPLYGLGDEKKKNSYVNMLRMKKIKNGYNVYASNRKHYGGNIKLNDLLEVHENGTIIKRGNNLIRIPPRPAFLMAYKNVLKKRIKRLKTTGRELKEAIIGYVNDASLQQFNRAVEKMMTGELKKYEIVD